jgi:5'(3')-deoxyribonucleotidase
MTKTLRVAVDMDEVIAQWVQAILDRHNKIHKNFVARDDIKEYWAMEKILGPQGKDFLRACNRDPIFYYDLKPVQGALSGLMYLVGRPNMEVMIATAAPLDAPASFHGKVAWMEKHLPQFDMKRFVCIQKKSLLDADILIDDALHNVEDWVASDPKRKALLYDAPWNKELPRHSRITRIKGWTNTDLYHNVETP